MVYQNSGDGVFWSCLRGSRRSCLQPDAAVGKENFGTPEVYSLGREATGGDDRAADG